MDKSVLYTSESNCRAPNTENKRKPKTLTEKKKTLTTRVGNQIRLATHFSVATEDRRKKGNIFKENIVANLVYPTKL